MYECMIMIGKHSKLTNKIICANLKLRLAPPIQPPFARQYPPNSYKPRRTREKMCTRSLRESTLHAANRLGRDMIVICGVG